MLSTVNIAFLLLITLASAEQAKHTRAGRALVNPSTDLHRYSAKLKLPRRTLTDNDYSSVSIAYSRDRDDYSSASSSYADDYSPSASAYSPNSGDDYISPATSTASTSGSGDKGKSSVITTQVKNSSSTQGTTTQVTKSTSTQVTTINKTCDKAHPKSQINSFLKSCDVAAQQIVKSIRVKCTSVNSTNVGELALDILADLKLVQSLLQTNLLSIQSCGTDSKPLSNDNGISLTVVSTTAFDMVETLKPIFLSISALYKQYPTVETVCSDDLTKVSTSLSSIIGACGEQINLFDVGFFKLVTPRMEVFQKIANHFAAFVGGFLSR